MSAVFDTSGSLYVYIYSLYFITCISTTLKKIKIKTTSSNYTIILT